MMKKNSQIHLLLETDLFDKLKKQAHEENISVAEMFRRKLRGESKLDRIESLLLQLNEMITYSIKYQKGGEHGKKIA